MSHNTCSISEECKEKFKSLRFRKDKTNAALLLKIDPKELLIVAEEYMDDTKLSDIAEALPESSPRFIVISFQLNHKDGRVSYPLAGVYYNPEGASTSNRMLYASSATLLFQEAGITGKVFDLQDSDDLTDDWLTAKLESSKTRP